MENLIKWFSKNHVAGNFLMLGVMIAGFTTWFGLRKEVMPDVTLESVSIRIPYPNATPEEVEQGIILQVEDAIADIDGVDQINSSAAQSMASVIVDVKSGYDVSELLSDIKTKVDAIANMPEEAEEPVITDLTIRSQVLSLAITADSDEATLRQIAEGVRDDLLTYEVKKKPFLSALRTDSKITQVELSGVRPYEISIEVSQSKLQELNLTTAQVAQAVRVSSLDLPGGAVDTDAGEVLIRTSAKRYTAAEFASVPIITNPDGSVVYLSDIATVKDGFEDVDISNQFDGKPAVMVDVFRVGEQDTLVISQAVKEYLEGAAQSLPEGVKVELWNDSSVMLQGRLNLLGKNAGIGILLVLIVLALFLRPSLAILVAIGIPVSFAGGIWMMPYTGISINMISLFAFILVLGVVVDDAIVVGENVYSKIQDGMNPKEAAWKGSHEVGVIVIFGVLTTMLAFTPMLGVDGVSGKYWRNIPWIVIPTLFFSLIQSKLVLPAHLAFLSPSSRNKKSWNPLINLQRKISDALELVVKKFYEPALEQLLKVRYIVVAVFIFLFIMSIGLVAGNRVKFVFFPKVEGDVVSVNLEMVPGTPYAKTVAAMDKLEGAIETLNAEFLDKEGNPGITHYTRSDGIKTMATGFSLGVTPIESNIGQMVVEFTPALKRNFTGAQVTARWREIVGDIPGAVELKFQSITAGGGNAIDMNLVGPDLEDLKAASAMAQSELAEIKGAIDIADSDREGKREIRIDALTSTGQAMGFTLEEVIRPVRGAFFGSEVQRLQRGKDEVKVMVRLPSEERFSVENIEQLRLRSPVTGEEVPLTQVALMKEGRGVATITRIDRQRSISISADVDPALANQTDVQKAFLGGNRDVFIKLSELPIVGKFIKIPEKGVIPKVNEEFPSVRFLASGEVKDRNDSMSQIGLGYLAALLGMYVLMAIPLRSYLKPLIVMSIIPFGIVGAIFGHMVMGIDLSIMSMCGIAALSGVVVNDSLVLVNFVDRYSQEYGKLEAARRAGAARFRAIILTSLTTFVGIMPMVLETDIQAKFLIPMAVSLGFGILFATFITLILVPSTYLILEDIKGAVRWLFTGKTHSMKDLPDEKNA